MGDVGNRANGWWGKSICINLAPVHVILPSHADTADSLLSELSPLIETMWWWLGLPGEIHFDFAQNAIVPTKHIPVFWQSWSHWQRLGSLLIDWDGRAKTQHQWSRWWWIQWWWWLAPKWECWCKSICIFGVCSRKVKAGGQWKGQLVWGNTRPNT